MDKLTREGQRRARAAAHLSNVVAEGESASHLLARQRQAGDTGLGAQEDVGGADWDCLVSALTSNKSFKTAASMAYHPDPKANMIQTPTGLVRIVKGEAGYTLNTGETVRL